MKQKSKLVWGWAMYDWANSAFATTVMAGFFPIFFKQYWSIGVDVNQSTAMLGFGNSIASLLVALMAPLLGAIADRGSFKKKFMIFFAYLGVLMTAGLYLVGKGEWVLAIFVYVMGVIGFSGANIFYDSLLPSVADESNVDSVSSLGFAMGYLGGGLLFLLNVVMTLQPTIFGLADAGEAVRWSFVSVALWWGTFTLISIAWVPEPEIGKNKSRENSIREGFNQLFRTFQEIRHLKTVLLFLLAYWFYIDGVDTIVKMAVDYGITIGFESNDLIIALLIVQFVGFPAALIFGRLGERWGVRPSIFLAIGVYIAVTIWGTMMREKYEFYVLAVVIGLVQGGIQALSRSYYSRIIPKNQVAEYFGFYNMLGKFAAILGPALMGIVGLMMRNVLMPENPSAEELIEVGQDAARWSIASIIVLFVIGAVLFYFVDEEKGRLEADYLSKN
ncbi:MAG: MFS transporter [Proteobacteria bacterium]|nr:MAG: MFS transporter [Pseudomonadota bacterium]|tara:strand:- start:191 stop:1525 length:1335 start_codon:yes stop_codon:yes gene_type:complete